MQLKTLLPSLLLLALRPEAAFAAPEDAPPTGSFLRASKPGVSKRNPFEFLMRPHYMAMPLGNAGSLAKRQSCPATYSECYEGCCPAKTVCGIYGGEKGCCPTGESCSGVGGCGKDQVTCSGYCCVEGSTCATDANGDPACATGENEEDDGGNEDTDDGCRAGYSPCTIFEGCCPTGSECILPQNCNIPCAADDPPCGPNGCCEKGSVCTEDFTCRADSSGDFTDLAPTTTTTRTSRFITYTTTTEEETETTIEEDTETSTTEESSTETTETSTSDDDFFGNDEDATTTTTTSSTRTVARVTITTDSGNAAPTMGAIIGNGLGVAAGLLGALVL